MAEEPRRRFRWAVVVGAAVLAVVVASVPVVFIIRDSSAERVVRDYLTAAQEGRVDDALEIAGVSRPDGERGRFIDPAAVSDAWQILEVDETLYSPGGNSPGRQSSAQVSVRIAGPGGATAESFFDLHEEDSEWVIEDPFYATKIPPTPLWYLDVNGMTAPAVENWGDVEYAFLPGFYRFFAEVPAGVESSDKVQPLLLPNMQPVAEVENPLDGVRFTLTENGESAARKAVKAYIDECAETIEPATPGCPFAADPSIIPDRTSEESVTWKVVEYPRIEVGDNARSFVAVSLSNGRVDLTERGSDTPSTECEIIAKDVTELEVGFTTKGDMRVVPSGTQYLDQDELTEDDAYPRDTCPFEPSF